MYFFLLFSKNIYPELEKRLLFWVCSILYATNTVVSDDSSLFTKYKYRPQSTVPVRVFVPVREHPYTFAQNTFVYKFANVDQLESLNQWGSLSER